MAIDAFLLGCRDRAEVKNLRGEESLSLLAAIKVMRFEQQKTDFYGVKEVRVVNFSEAPGKEVESSPGMSKLISHIEKILKAFDKLLKKVGLSSDGESEEVQVQRFSRRCRGVRSKRKSGDVGEFQKSSEPRLGFRTIVQVERGLGTVIEGKRWEISSPGL